ncbi:uncharacterized protein [Choristoneura fumiferana]|uniref:uncharacterized protein n=1 Tax=Choristoneura fumiferana TaxID=7141 RepID=UPI003D158EF6
MTHTYCAVYKCKSKSRKEKELRFHKFPRNSMRREAWIEACGRADLKLKTDQQLNNMRVCCLHFEKNMYRYGENQLIDVAVPTLNLPPSSAFSVYIQTEPIEENKISTNQEFLVPCVNIKKEATTDTNSGYGAGHPSENEYNVKRIKVENDIESGDYTGGGLGTRQMDPDVTVEQFLRGCELYLTPELRQYVRTQIIIPH